MSETAEITSTPMSTPPAGIDAALAADPRGAPTPRARSILGIWAELTKVRLNALVLVTTAVGFALAELGPIDWLSLAWTCVGTALAAASASLFNQLFERRRDALMLRTRGRPLPAKQVHPAAVFTMALLTGYAGAALLGVLVGLLPAALAAFNILLYALLYTPLKPRTTFNTLVGAVCGAIPPVIGWTAVTGSIDPGAWLLGGSTRAVDEGIDRDVHRPAEALARGVRHHRSHKLFLAGKGDGMDEEVDFPPLGSDLREGGVHAGVIRHVSGDHRVHADRLDQRPYAALKVLALVGEGDLRPLRRELLRDPPGDGTVVCNAHHDAAFALHQVASWEGPFRHGRAPLAEGRGVGEA